jgi:hypothetical protein
MATDTVTNRAKKEILDGTTPLTTAEDIRMAVLLDTGAGEVAAITAATVQDLNTMADLDAITGVSFHSERIALASETVTEDDTNNWALFDSADVVYAAAPGVTARGVAVYSEGGGTDATRTLISVHTTGFPQPMDGGLTVATPNGIIRGT